MHASNSTIERIYNAAEQLFADKGFSEISLRLITAKANVNLAAVNYHFGSKQGLIEAVFSRYLVTFCNGLNVKLDYLESQPNTPPSTEELLTTFLELAISIKTPTSKGIVTFMRLLSSALMQQQPFLHQYLLTNFGDILYRYATLLKKSANPDISDLEWFWRVHFSLGTILQNMACIDFLKLIVKNNFKINVKTPEIIQLMVPFIVAGLSVKPCLTVQESKAAKIHAPSIKDIEKQC